MLNEAFTYKNITNQQLAHDKEQGTIALYDESEGTIGLFCKPKVEQEFRNLFLRFGWVTYISLDQNPKNNLANAWNTIKDILIKYRIIYTKVQKGLITLHAYLHVDNKLSGDPEKLLPEICVALENAKVVPGKEPPASRRVPFEANRYLYYRHNEIDFKHVKPPEKSVYFKPEITFSKSITTEHALDLVFAHQLFKEVGHWSVPTFSIENAWSDEEGNHILFSGNTERIMEVGKFIMGLYGSE